MTHHQLHNVQISNFTATSSIQKNCTNINNKGKDILIESLVDTTAFLIETIWSDFPVISTAQLIPLRLFIIETLKRSRTYLSTLKIAQLYLLRIKSKINSLRPTTTSINDDCNNNKVDNKNTDSAICCRRMFLASLIVASKYLQDKNYSNAAWSKICGLQVKEINIIERRFLELIGYNLYVTEGLFDNWTNLLNSCLSSKLSVSSLDISNNNNIINNDNNNNGNGGIVHFNISHNDMNVQSSNSDNMSVNYSNGNTDNNSDSVYNSDRSIHNFEDPNSSIVLAPIIMMSQSKECRVKG